MQKLKVALKVLNSKSKFETKLIRLTSNTVPDINLDKQLKPLIQIATTSDTTEDGAKVLDILNTYLRDCKTWLPAIKLLYVSHEFINNLGKKFCDSFLAEYFEKIHDMSTKQKNDVEDFVHGVLVANYYNFLIIYAKYFPDIQTYLSKDASQLSKSLQEGEYTVLIHLLSFKNLVKYFTKLEECIEGSASVLKEQGLIDKITFIIFRDTITVYNLISLNLQPAMQYIFKLDADIALLLDELYSDMLQLTNKMRHMIVKAGLEKRPGIPHIKYFPFDADFNKQEELYILDLKKFKPKQDPDAPKKPYQQFMQQYQTLAPGRRLYKLNTGVTHLTKVLEIPKSKTKDYFNLQSPEFSHMEDDSIAPIKTVDENSDTPLSPGSGSASVIDKTQSYKDVTNPLQLEIQIIKSKPLSPGSHGSPNMNFKIKNEPEFSDMRGAESVLFSPTSSHKAHGDDNYILGDLGSKRGSKFNFSKQDNADRNKDLKLNLANL